MEEEGDFAAGETRGGGKAEEALEFDGDEGLVGGVVDAQTGAVGQDVVGRGEGVDLAHRVTALGEEGAQELNERHLGKGREAVDEGGLGEVGPGGFGERAAEEGNALGELFGGARPGEALVAQAAAFGLLAGFGGDVAQGAALEDDGTDGLFFGGDEAAGGFVPGDTGGGGAAAEVEVGGREGEGPADDRLGLGIAHLDDEEPLLVDKGGIGGQDGTEAGGQEVAAGGAITPTGHMAGEGPDKIGREGVDREARGGIAAGPAFGQAPHLARLFAQGPLQDAVDVGQLAQGGELLALGAEGGEESPAGAVDGL